MVLFGDRIVAIVPLSVFVVMCVAESEFLSLSSRFPIMFVLIPTQIMISTPAKNFEANFAGISRILDSLAEFF